MLGNVAGTFTRPPHGIILHSTRSGRYWGEENEYIGTLSYVDNGAAGLGWNATIGPGEICEHINVDHWGWNARGHSRHYLAIEFAQARLGDPISDESIAAAAYWIKHFAEPSWPNVANKLIEHRELAAGIADGKTDIGADQDVPNRLRLALVRLNELEGEPS